MNLTYLFANKKYKKILKEIYTEHPELNTPAKESIKNVLRGLVLALVCLMLPFVWVALIASFFVGFAGSGLWGLGVAVLFVLVIPLLLGGR